MNVTTEYVTDCVRGRYADWTRRRIAGAGDAYFDADSARLKFVSAADAEGFDFTDGRRFFIPSLDDLLEFLDILLPQRGDDPRKTPISIVYKPESGWTARIGSIETGDREDVGVGKDSPHTALSKAILAALIVSEAAPAEDKSPTPRSAEGGAGHVDISE